jgi:hypothetical protein
MNRVVLAMLAALAAAAFFTIPALAHQTVTSNGARVTMHVNPDDAPEAGVSTSIRILKVAVPRGGRFSFSSCGCRLKITNSAGTILRNSAMKSRTTFRFPSAGAYRLTYSGKYTRSGKRKRFSASFAIRAS